MNKEIFNELVLRMSQDDSKVNRFKPYPVLKEFLIPILKQKYPEVNFNNLGDKIDDNGKKIIGARGESWDNIIEFSGLKRFDFCIKDGPVFDDDENPVLITPYFGYKSATISSVIHHNKEMTYSTLSRVIQNLYDGETKAIVMEQIGTKK